MTAPHFTADTAGSHPTARVSPHAPRQITGGRTPVDGLRGKTWDEFARPGASPIHFVFTVCDTDAVETCPVWPGSASDGKIERSRSRRRDRHSFDAVRILHRRIDRS
jgi:arsenate reductase